MLLIDISPFPCGCCWVNERCFRIVCRVIPVVSKDLRTKFPQNVLLPTELLLLFHSSEAFNPSQLLFSFLNATICFISGSCTYSSDNKAFLFSLYNNNGYNPVKLTQYQNQQYAIYRCSTYGPTFGYGGENGHDIYIPDNPIINQPTNPFTRCGSTYSAPPGYSDGDCGFFTGALHFTPSDIEVFYEIGKYKNDAILFSMSLSAPFISERCQYF